MLTIATSLKIHQQQQSLRIPKSLGEAVLSVYLGISLCIIIPSLKSCWCIL